jgi:hypothetical protein
LFRWDQFFERHNIHFTIDRGERNATTHCPFCGEADEKGHDLAISLQGRGFKCWRNSKHRGKSKKRLIQAFLHCTWERAAEIAGESSITMVRDGSVSSDLPNSVRGEIAHSNPIKLKLPKEFRPLEKRTAISEPFWKYMTDPIPDGRGYTIAEARWLSDFYDLHYAIRGEFRYRIIIPIRDQSGQLLTWTGRHVDKKATLRYKSLSTDERAVDEGDPVAIASTNSTLLGLDTLWQVKNPSVLAICEGPMDAFRITSFGHKLGVYGTCLFGLNPSDDQAELLEELHSQRFPELRLITDVDAAMRSFSVRQAFLTLPVKMTALPEGIKDPGALPRGMAGDFIQQMI